MDPKQSQVLRPYAWRFMGTRVVSGVSMVIPVFRVLAYLLISTQHSRSTFGVNQYLQG